MTARNYSSIAGAMTLTGNITSADASIVVSSVVGLPVSTPYTLVLDVDEAAEEIVTVTAAAGSTLTVVRGEDGSAAQAHSAGAKVRHMATARDYREPQQHINAATGVHGLAAGESVAGASAISTAISAAIATEVADRQAADALLVPATRTINAKPLSADVTLAAADVGAATTGHGHALTDAGITGTLTVAKGGTGAADAATARTNLGAAATTHTHATSQVTGLDTALAGKAATTHTHPTSDVTGLDTALAGKAANPLAGGRAVGDVTGTNKMGLRWNGSAPVIKVDTTEVTVATTTDLTSGLATKTNAQGDVNTAPRADGSDRPFEAASGPGTYYAVWVDANHDFFRNTSSIRFKENVRDAAINPADVLALRPVIFDRSDGSRIDEVGLIAEEVDTHLPWLVVRLNSEIDGLHYHLLPIALLALAKDQQAKIDTLTTRVAAIEARLA